MIKINQPTLDDILKDVLRAFPKLTDDSLKGNCKDGEIVSARRLFAFVASKKINAEPVEISKALNKSTAVVHYYLRTCKEWLEIKDRKFIKQIERYKLKSIYH